MKFLLDLLLWVLNMFNPSDPSPAPTPAPTPKPPHSDPDTTPILNYQLLKAHNEARAAKNVAPLSICSLLNDAAYKHAAYMASRSKLSHIGIKLSSSSHRIKEEGYLASHTGENIASGYTTVADVMDGWLKSNGHRNNIMSNHYQECGFGMVNNYWCAVFATPSTNLISVTFLPLPSESGPLSTD